MRGGRVPSCARAGSAFNQEALLVPNSLGEGEGVPA
jgi:hypothetical protein